MLLTIIFRQTKKKYLLSQIVEFGKKKNIVQNRDDHRATLNGGRVTHYGSASTPLFLFWLFISFLYFFLLEILYKKIKKINK
jgi:hypothetical protein